MLAAGGHLIRADLHATGDLRMLRNGHAPGLPGQVPGTRAGHEIQLWRRIWP
jgi:hypothetical protein